MSHLGHVILAVMLLIGAVLFRVGCWEVPQRGAGVGAYPYRAAPEREAAIRAGYRQVDAGMGVADVHRLMGTPDRVRPLYERPVKTAKQIGWTHWYIIGQGRKEGSPERVVRVAVDLEHCVTRVDHWGVEEGR